MVIFFTKKLCKKIQGKREKQTSSLSKGKQMAETHAGSVNKYLPLFSLFIENFKIKNEKNSIFCQKTVKDSLKEKGKKRERRNNYKSYFNN